MRLFLRHTLAVTLVVVSCAHAVPAPDASAGFAIPTFHCLGLYWSPPGGTREREVKVLYRAKGEKEWQEGLPMRFNPIEGTDEDLADYRGSIVNLRPGTMYEVRFTLDSISATITASTWSESFPAGDVLKAGDSHVPLVITESGKPGAWRVYDGTGVTIDVRHQHDACITIDASHVIVRGFALKGAGSPSNTSGRPIGAITILRGHDIIIEDCDISGWGRLNKATGFGFDYDAAIWSRRQDMQRMIVQRCRMHHPAFDTNTWSEPVNPTHPAGPQCISLFDTAGNHVIRWNECYSDMEHMFNDVIGGGGNGSHRGSPGSDSDIYGNFISHCWDDGLEVEGGSRNVRVWGNYITQSYNMIGNAPASIGPLYIWRNVLAICQGAPDTAGMNFLKMGYATSEDWMTGHQYIFHNTLFGPAEWLPTGGLGGNRIVKHTISRNNILHVHAATDRSISAALQNTDNSFDYDLFNARVPSGHEKHGVNGVPVYQNDARFDEATMTGRFQLQPNSPGAGAGIVIPNFSDGFTGKAPDMGAHQRGEAAMRFGVRAASPAEK